MITIRSIVLLFVIQKHNHHYRRYAIFNIYMSYELKSC